MSDSILRTMSNIEQIRWIASNRICFCTNSKCLPGSLFAASISMYINRIPMHNMYIINGNIQNNAFHYGITAFIEMMAEMLSNNHFDYVVYIDEDCFITDFTELLVEVESFINSGCCIAGEQDGGMISHRNHSSMLVNTFLSFWNIKALRDSNITYNTLIDNINFCIQNKNNIYKIFYSTDSFMSKELHETIESSALKNIEKCKIFRHNVISNTGESEYANIVKNDPNNKVEPHQIPYSYNDINETINFEPYYALEEAIIKCTGLPVYYMFYTDLYFNENQLKRFGLDTNIDNGLTSMVVSRNDTPDTFKIIAVHTWFSRMYTKWPKHNIQIEHSRRINNVISFCKKLQNELKNN